jgi:flagellum-specific ATP synthase
LLGAYEENRDYIQIGTYQAGSNPQLDQAIQLMPQIEKYLCQDMDQLSTHDEAIAGLRELLAGR